MSALQYLHGLPYGLVSEATWPYQAGGGKVPGCNSAVYPFGVVKPLKIWSQSSQQSVTTIQNNILQYGAVAVSINGATLECFMFYNGQGFIGDGNACANEDNGDTTCYNHIDYNSQDIGYGDHAFVLAGWTLVDGIPVWVSRDWCGGERLQRATDAPPTTTDHSQQVRAHVRGASAREPARARSGRLTRRPAAGARGGAPAGTATSRRSTTGATSRAGSSRSPSPSAPRTATPPSPGTRARSSGRATVSPWATTSRTTGSER